MDQNEPGPSGIKKPKIATRSKIQRYLTEDELDKLLCNSDEDLNEASLLMDMDEDDSSEDEDRIENESERPSETASPFQFDGSLQLHVASDSIQRLISENLNWNDEPTLNTFTFEKENRLLVPLTGDQPIDMFNLLLDEQFYELVTTETNAYAEKVFLSEGVTDQSRISRWKPTTSAEMKIFFGLYLHMGTIHLARIQDYWKTDRLFNISCFRDTMSRDRFLQLLRCLHFVENPEIGDPKPTDRLFKIRPLVDYFNNKMAEIYYPGQNLSIDESMVLWRGRLSFRQYIPNKRHKYGVKFYMLTEPSGINLKFLIYTGALGDYGGTGHAANVVLSLMEGKLDIGHSLFMDNFYNSYNLSQQLLQRKTHSTGTLRIDRKNSPQMVKQAKLRKGETIAKYANGVMIGKWRDKRDVIYISTEFQNNLVKYFNKRMVEKIKPHPIIHYNKNMGGVDRQDQFMSYYPCARKCLRWYKKIGFHIFVLLVLNSYLFHKKYFNNKLSYYDFRLEIIRLLLPEKVAISGPKVLSHFISHCKKGVSGKTLRRRCIVCAKQGLRKDIPYECKACQAGFCLEPCFEIFHRDL